MKNYVWLDLLTRSTQETVTITVQLFILLSLLNYFICGFPIASNRRKQGCFVNIQYRHFHHHGNEDRWQREDAEFPPSADQSGLDLCMVPQIHCIIFIVWLLSVVTCSYTQHWFVVLEIPDQLELVGKYDMLLHALIYIAISYLYARDLILLGCNDHPRGLMRRHAGVNSKFYLFFFR